MPERRRGQIDVDRRSLLHQFFHRVDLVKAALPEAFVVPRVFANGDGQPHTIQFHHLLRLGGRNKIALFVEDIVKRQQPFVLFKQQSPAIQQNRCIHRGLAATTFRSQGHAGKHSGGQVAGGRGKLIHGLTAARQEAWLFKEVGRRIAADYQFRKDREPRAQRSRTSTRLNNLFKISAEIPNCWINLGQCDLHTSSLIPPAAVTES